MCVCATSAWARRVSSNTGVIWRIAARYAVPSAQPACPRFGVSGPSCASNTGGPRHIHSSRRNNQSDGDKMSRNRRHGYCHDTGVNILQEPCKHKSA
jgi:hypothetical protein